VLDIDFCNEVTENDLEKLESVKSSLLKNTLCVLRTLSPRKHFFAWISEILLQRRRNYYNLEI
jgi:hypothetical protein